MSSFPYDYVRSGSRLVDCGAPDNLPMGSFDFCTCVQPRTTKLAIVNRPHVSKSTLLNRIVCDDGVLTGPEYVMKR